ncbi:MAG TPA: hypothetical protein VLJ16_12700, partial [Acidobacteriota bacterium]|nr:hypothetical protein [Acidobacteriota bacterium]
FNNLLNPRRNPWVEAVAVNGVGVFETLREIAKLTVPVVREKVLGEKRREAPGPEEVSADDIDHLGEGLIGQKGDVELVADAEAPPLQVTKVKIKSHKEIEDELEKLSRDFTSKRK